MSVSVDEIRAMYRDALSERADANYDAVKRHWYRCKLLSTCISGMVLGYDWFERSLASEERPLYFRPNELNEDTYPRSAMREIELAEMIFNLRNVDQFEERMKDVRTASKRGIETKVSELMGGRFFRQHNILFNFRPPSGRKQDDYDIDYVRTDGKIGHCEVKAKELGTELTPNTICNTLKAAKSQLPKGETGIIMFRSPEEWVPFPDGVEQLRMVLRSIEDWFEKERTTRVSSVLFFDNRTDVHEEMVYTNCYYREIRNRFCKDVSGLPGLYTGENNITLRHVHNWIRLPDLVRQWS